MQVLSVNLSKIDKTKITTSKNGDKYISLVVDTRKEVDPYGNDLMVYINQTKEDRESKQPKAYCGGGKTLSFTKTEQPTVTTTAPSDDDLGF